MIFSPSVSCLSFGGVAAAVVEGTGCCGRGGGGEKVAGCREAGR